jgi:hypothetical protein
VFSNLLPGNNNNKERAVYNFSDKTVAALRKTLTYTLNNAKVHNMIYYIKDFSNDIDSVLDFLMDIF